MRKLHLIMPVAALACALAAACGSGNTTTVTVTNGQQGGGATVPGSQGGGGSVLTQPTGQLALMDSGFSQYSQYGTHGINYALLIKNQSGDASFDQADVTVSFLNKAGTSVASDETYVHAIPPSKVGAVVSDVTDVPAGAKVAKMVVELGEPYDWQDMPSGELIGKVVSVHASNNYGTYEVKTTALFKSSYAQQLKDTEADVVYRDASHKIIGGFSDFLKVIPAHGKANIVFDDYPNFSGIKHVEVYATPTSITEFG